VYAQNPFVTEGFFVELVVCRFFDPAVFEENGYFAQEAFFCGRVPGRQMVEMTAALVTSRLMWPSPSRRSCEATVRRAVSGVLQSELRCAR
jgi:hypothetical protein